MSEKERKDKSDDKAKKPTDIGETDPSLGPELNLNF